MVMGHVPKIQEKSWHKKKRSMFKFVDYNGSRKETMTETIGYFLTVFLL
jgi:hypothetical protein